MCAYLLFIHSSADGRWGCFSGYCKYCCYEVRGTGILFGYVIFFLEKLSFLNVVTDFKDTDVLQLCRDSSVLFPSVFTLLQAEHKEEIYPRVRLPPPSFLSFRDTRMWVHSCKELSWSTLWEMVKNREAWGTAVHAVAKSWTWLVTKQQPKCINARGPPILEGRVFLC